MGNENKKTQSMASTSSRHNSPRGSETFPQPQSSATPPQSPQQISMSPSFDQLPQFLSPSPMMSPPPAPMSPPLSSFAGNTFMPTTTAFNPLTLPNSGFLTTPITSGLSMPFSYPPIKLPPAPPLYRFNKYDSLFEEYDYGLSRYRPRYYCPNYCPPRDCHCPPQFQPSRPHSSQQHHRSHHSTSSNHHSSHHHNEKRHERRSLDHHSSKHHHSQSSQSQPVRVICRNA